MKLSVTERWNTPYVFALYTACVLFASPFNAAFAAAPSIGKTFVPSSIVQNGTSFLVITLSNPNPVVANLQAPLVDMLPSGLTAVSVVSNNCNGTVSNVSIADPTKVVLLAGGIPAAAGGVVGTCSFSVIVTAATPDNYDDMFVDGALQTDQGSNEGTVCATLNVTPSLITVAKAFSSDTIVPSGTTVLDIAITNNSAVTATGVSLTDSFAPLTATASTATSTCPSLVPTNTTTSVSVSGSIPAATTCVISVTITPPGSGSFVNTIPAGALQSSLGSNLEAAIVSLSVEDPAGSEPVVGKHFDSYFIDQGSPSILFITLSNPTASTPMTGVAFTDQLPPSFDVTNITQNCGGQVVNSSNQIIFTNGMISAGSFCQIAITFTANAGGNFVNTIGAGAVTADGGLANVDGAIATLTVNPFSLPVSVNKSFVQQTVNVGQPSTVTITLNNPGALAATLTTPFVDYFSPDLQLSSASTTCTPGIATISGSTLTLSSGASIPGGGSCTITATVVTQIPGNYIDNIPVNALQTSNGMNLVDACATLTVVSAVPAPVVQKTFNPDEICIFEETAVVITLINLSDTIASITSFVDYLPKDLKVIHDDTFTTCGGVLDVHGRNVRLTGGFIPAMGSCIVKVQVEATAWGVFHNTIPIGALQTSLGPNTASVTATLTVRDNRMIKTE